VDRIGPGRTALGAFLLGGLAQLFIPLAPAESLAGASFLVVSQLLGDGFITIYSITETSLRQRAVPVEALGRTAAVRTMAGSIVAPLGMVLGALLAEYVGIRGAVWIFVGGLIASSVPLIANRRALELPTNPR